MKYSGIESYSTIFHCDCSCVQHDTLQRHLESSLHGAPLRRVPLYGGDEWWVVFTNPQLPSSLVTPLKS